MTGLINDLIEVGSAMSIAAIGQWIVVYSALEPWWRRGNRIGHSLVLFALYGAVTPVLFLLSLVFHLTGAGSQVLAWAEITLLCVLIPAGMLRRTAVWIQVSRRGTRGTLPAGDRDEEDQDGVSPA